MSVQPFELAATRTDFCQAGEETFLDSAEKDVGIRVMGVSGIFVSDIARIAKVTLDVG
jgi:hypothetical protein